MQRKRSFTPLIAHLSLTARAEPAPRYWWVSRLADAGVCMQTSPGAGWYRTGGPYRNGRATKLRQG